MKLVHLTPGDYATSTWSGGTTTQVAIAPAGAVYADRDFLWRISSATVDLEISDFTALPDYDRLIATLQGEIDVTHNDGDVMHLAPYHVHAFDGGWKTRSVGRCTDFNLMVRKGACRGQMQCLAVSANAPASFLPVSDGADHTDAVIYCAEGSVQVCVGGQSAALAAGESAMVCDAAEAISLSGCGKTVCCGVNY